MNQSRLRSIAENGQSIWYDNIQRSMISDGSFEKMIVSDDLRGVTSNPTIFDKAISKSTDYDRDIAQLLDKKLSVEEIYWNLVIHDIQKTADVFRPVYDKTEGVDGFVSIEVSPLLARDTDGTIAQARELYKRVDRENVMIKVPATLEGLPAIKTLIADGIPVNVTLIFSLERYQSVIDSYISGLEERLVSKGQCGPVASVASFFVSRVDSAVDTLLNQEGMDPEKSKELIGKTAIANSKLAYQLFKKSFGAERFKVLKEKGAIVQRPLWASTSTKNPEFSDVLYVESLIGPDTVNTLPPATVEAFKDHGAAKNSIEDNIEEAQNIPAQLKLLGIDLEQVTLQLEEDGVESFCQSFRQLLDHLKHKEEQLISGGASHA